MVATSAGALENESDFYPFGGESAITQNLTNQHYKFEGKERDSESSSLAQPQGLDNFGARFDSSNTGRFISPDWANSPEPVPYSKLSNPQTLNLYSFAQNNPESAPDLDGHQREIACPGVLDCAGGISSGLSENANTDGDIATRAFARGLDPSKAIQDFQNFIYQAAIAPIAQQHHQGVSITFQQYRKGKDGNSIVIELGAKVSQPGFIEFNWVQVIINTDSSDGTPGVPFLDRDKGQTTPYYYNPEEEPRREAIARKSGLTASFFDNPGRPVHTAIIWHAELDFVGIKSNGDYHVLAHFSYGFSKTRAGVITMEPLVQK